MIQERKFTPPERYLGLLKTVFGRKHHERYQQLRQDILQDPKRNQLLVDTVDRALSVLNPRRRRVLSLLYGLEDNEPKTAEQIGTELGAAEVRIRQMKINGINNLKRPDRFEDLVSSLSI